MLRRLSGRDSVAGLIRGRAVRLLLDDGQLAEDETARLMGLALSPGAPPADAAAWIEGFVGGASGAGTLLVHDERLLGLVDAWLAGVAPEAFTGVLPLLRRTFSAYEPGARRTLGELVRRGTGTGGASVAGGARGPVVGVRPVEGRAAGLRSRRPGSGPRSTRRVRTRSCRYCGCSSGAVGPLSADGPCGRMGPGCGSDGTGHGGGGPGADRWGECGPAADGLCVDGPCGGGPRAAGPCCRSGPPC